MSRLEMFCNTFVKICVGTHRSGERRRYWHNYWSAEGGRHSVEIMFHSSRFVTLECDWTVLHNQMLCKCHLLKTPLPRLMTGCWILCISSIFSSAILRISTSISIIITWVQMTVTEDSFLIPLSNCRKKKNLIAFFVLLLGMRKWKK